MEEKQFWFTDYIYFNEILKDGIKPVL